MVDLDVRAVVDLTRRFLPGMVARGRGGVLNIASMMGFMPVPYQAAYAAAKAFVLSFTKALAYETMGTGVKVSVAAPGVVATRLHAKAGALNARSSLPVSGAHPRAGRENRLSALQPGLVHELARILEQSSATFIVRFVPDFLLVPVIGWFFRMRDDEGRVLWPGGAIAREPKRKRAPEPVRLETTE